jgi:hypothetical protein
MLKTDGKKVEIRLEVRAKTAQCDDTQTRTFLERIPCIAKTFVSNV